MLSAGEKLSSGEVTLQNTGVYLWVLVVFFNELKPVLSMADKMHRDEKNVTRIIKCFKKCTAQYAFLVYHTYH